MVLLSIIYWTNFTQNWNPFQLKLKRNIKVSIIVVGAISGIFWEKIGAIEIKQMDNIAATAEAQ